MQMTTYEISEDTFMDAGTWQLWPEWVYGSTFYAQQSGLLWMVSKATLWDKTSEYTNTLSMYDMTTNIMHSLYVNASINIPTTSCIASDSDSSLYILGVGEHLKAVIAYNTNTLTWNENITSMIEVHPDGTCIVDAYNVLYAIGGIGFGVSGPPQIERLDTNDLSVNEWEYNVEQFGGSVVDAKAVLYGDMIFVIGGYRSVVGDSMSLRDSVYIINSRNHSVHRMAKLLPFAVHGMCAVVVDQVLYSFGGFAEENGNATAQWMTYTLDHMFSVCALYVHHLFIRRGQCAL